MSRHTKAGRRASFRAYCARVVYDAWLDGAVALRRAQRDAMRRGVKIAATTSHAVFRITVDTSGMERAAQRLAVAFDAARAASERFAAESNRHVEELRDEIAGLS